MRWINSYAKLVSRSLLLTMRRHTTILLVEAQDDIRLLVAVSLRRLGYSVIEAHTVTDACAKFGNADGAVALLLSEAVLPDGTGTDLYRLLVAVEPRLRLLLIAGHRESTSIQLVADDQATDFILKPFSLDALIEKVRDLLSGGARLGPALVRSRNLFANSVC